MPNFAPSKRKNDRDENDKKRNSGKSHWQVVNKLPIQVGYNPELCTVETKNAEMRANTRQNLKKFMPRC